MRTLAPLFALLVTLSHRRRGAVAGRPRSRRGAGRALRLVRVRGHDSVYDAHRPGPSEYLNPILSGFYPDPSLARVGDDYYLIASTFAYFPGIPIFRSKDLVNWTQIGNVIHRPEQLRFDSFGMSRGVFAPTIEHHAGTFYVLNTCVDCGGNFLVTATNPAGPWSDPVWLPEVGGIDPSIFFDDDGKAYVINNDAPPGGSTYPGHRAIWIREFDVAAKKVKGPATKIINGGVDLAQKPIWIEGPHIYKIDGKYYLSCAEGGTAVDHRQVVFRADNVLGPYVPAPAPTNPILTQRHLDPRGRTRSRRPATPTSCRRRTASGGGSSSPRGRTRGTSTTPGARPSSCRSSGRTAGRRSSAGATRSRTRCRGRTFPRSPRRRSRRTATSRCATTSRPALAPYWLMIRTPREPSSDLAATR